MTVGIFRVYSPTVNSNHELTVATNSAVAYGSLRARPARKAKAKPTGRETDDDSNA